MQETIRRGGNVDFVPYFCGNRLVLVVGLGEITEHVLVLIAGKDTNNKLRSPFPETAGAAIGLRIASSV